MFTDLKMNIISITRNENIIVPNEKDKIKTGDSVYVIADTEHLHRVMTAFGHQEKVLLYPNVLDQICQPLAFRLATPGATTHCHYQ